MSLFDFCVWLSIGLPVVALVITANLDWFLGLAFLVVFAWVSYWVGSIWLLALLLWLAWGEYHRAMDG